MMKLSSLPEVILLQQKLKELNDQREAFAGGSRVMCEASRGHLSTSLRVKDTERIRAAIIHSIDVDRHELIIELSRLGVEVDAP